MEHDLKIWPAFFDAVASGEKRFEMRKNDRNYQPRDVLLLREWNPKIEQYTGRSVRVAVTHVLRMKELDADLKNIMGLNPCPGPVNELAVLSVARI